MLLIDTLNAIFPDQVYVRTQIVKMLARMEVRLGAMGCLRAQNPLSDELRQAYGEMKNNVLRSAEKMPEENYSFRPAPRVRTFGELLGHIAQEQYPLFAVR